MLFLAIALTIFSHSLLSCELPEHLQKKKKLSIRTPDGNIDKNFLSERVKYSGLLCQLATCKSDIGVDIDLMSDKDSNLKILTITNLYAVLGLIGNTDLHRWKNEHSQINFRDPFECITLVDTIKFLDFQSQEDEIINHFINASNVHSAESRSTLNFRYALFHYSQGKTIPSRDFEKKDPFCIISLPKKAIDFNNMGDNPGDSHKKSGDFIIYNNDLTSITFDAKQNPPLKSITLINQPQKPTPYIKFKNLSGYDGLSLTLKDADIPAEQHQELRKLLWPPWYKPAALLTTLKYGCLQTLVIGGSLTNLTWALMLQPMLFLSEYVIKKINSDFVNVPLIFINAVPIITIGLFELCALSPLRSKIYEHYAAPNKLTISGKKEEFSSYYPMMIKKLHKKINFITQLLDYKVSNL